MSVIKRIVIALALLCSVGTANAQAAVEPFKLPDCVFKSAWTPFGTGTDWMHDTIVPASTVGVTISWWAWWCPNPDGTWWLYVHRCVEGRTCLNSAALTNEFDTAARSADKLGSLRSAIALRQAQPLPSETSDWLYAMAVASQRMQALKPAAPPPPAAGVYVVTGSQAFPLKPDGTRSTTPIAAAPTKGETCDCSGANRILQFGATFCKVPSLSTAQTIVAGCSLKKP